MGMLDKVRALRWRDRVVRSAQACFCNPDGSLHKNGEVLITYLRNYCYLNTPIHAVTRDGHTDVPATMVAEGRRQAVLHLLQLLDMDPNAAHNLNPGEYDA